MELTDILKIPQEATAGYLGFCFKAKQCGRFNHVTQFPSLASQLGQGLEGKENPVNTVIASINRSNGIPSILQQFIPKQLIFIVHILVFCSNLRVVSLLNRKKHKKKQETRIFFQPKITLSKVIDYCIQLITRNSASWVM